ncbi:MAG: ImmA/IrrE family metallo-endopeptidase [Clostridia bacterium]|nr:ImmA/IrrE family metallo-endopeptidase [Clostridia bacterium]
MLYETIVETGARIVKKYGTRDPFRLAEELGIRIKYVDNFKTLKGCYQVILRNRWIFINSNLKAGMRRIVCAHEIGHDQLHRHLVSGGRTLMEFELYDMKNRPEYEANIFASEILLDTDEILDYIYNYGYDVQQIAAVMRSDVNLVALKISSLNREGYQLRIPDYKSNFLK